MCVLNSLPTYYFSIYKAPVKVLDILERLRRVFFWGGTDVNSHMSWMAWERVIAPIEYGGLGFGSLRDSNLAMLSKWWWRFKTDKDGLWRRVVWAFHHNNRSWAPVPAKMSLAGPWKQIVGSCGKLNQVGIDLSSAIRCKVGCGSKVAFWLDLWIGDHPLYLKFPQLFALERVKICNVADRVVWDPNTVKLAWEWSRLTLSESEQEELTELMLLICDYNASSGPDLWCWRHDTSGVFSVASIKCISASASISVPDYIFKWNKLVPKKVGIVAWRALSERLPTRAALAARNIYIEDPRCLFCGEYEETSEHIFVSCHFSQSIWLIVAQWCKIPPIIAFSLKDIIDAYDTAYGSKRKKQIISAIIQVVIWCLWKLRNDVLFGQASPSITSVVQETKSLAYHWIKNRSGQSQWSWNEWVSFNMTM
ncbi:putative reverse transcriptase zinc-binding domain-containing protein [Helianthus annuus]|nr:putative reverse transcriptase zinc-binding domain-containing protein [Helianthus annuus]